MHVEITPAGRLVGKVLRVFFRGLLFGIPLAMVVTLLFYGVRCTGSLVGSMLGAGRAPQVAMVAPSSLPPTQVAPAQPLPRSEKSDRPQESAATPDTPLVPPP